MRKWILIIASHLFLLQLAAGQDEVGCNQLLEDAKEAYSAGMVELVPELLNSCIESGLVGSAKLEAYQLVITSYLFDYLPQEADTFMVRFLDEFPNYQAKTSDPAEFTMLLNSHKEVRAEAAREQERQDVLDAQARNEEQIKLEEERKQQEKTERQTARKVPVQAKNSGPAIGFILGTNLSMPQLVEPYSVADPSIAGGSFGMGSPGFHIGASLVLPLSDKVETVIDVLYQRVRFNYSAAPYTFISYVYDEYQNRFSLPVSFLFHFNPEGQNKVYFRAGVVADYLMSASGSGVRSYTGGGGGSPDVTIDQTDITSARSGLNLSALGGLGIRFPLNGGFIFAETRYQYGFFLQNQGAKRYDNQDFIWSIYHVDSDFKLHQLSISTGMVFYLK